MMGRVLTQLRLGLLVVSGEKLRIAVAWLWGGEEKSFHPKKRRGGRRGYATVLAAGGTVPGRRVKPLVRLSRLR